MKRLWERDVIAMGRPISQKISGRGFAEKIGKKHLGARIFMLFFIEITKEALVDASGRVSNDGQ